MNVAREEMNCVGDRLERQYATWEGNQRLSVVVQDFECGLRDLTQRAQRR
jgi:hypothetical protein